MNLTVFRPVICVILRNEVTKNLLRIIKTMPERSFAFAQDDTKGNAKCRDLPWPPLLRGGCQIADLRQFDWGSWCILSPPGLPKGQTTPLTSAGGKACTKPDTPEIATQATPARNDKTGTKHLCRDRRPRQPQKNAAQDFLRRGEKQYQSSSTSGSAASRDDSASIRSPTSELVTAEPKPEKTKATGDSYIKVSSLKSEIGIFYHMYPACQGKSAPPAGEVSKINLIFDGGVFGGFILD